MGHLCAYFAGLLRDRVPDVQGAVSARLALLGGRIGSELEWEVREAVVGLRRWQEQALRAAARAEAARPDGVAGLGETWK